MAEKQIVTSPSVEPWYHKITVEPIGFLDILAVLLISVVEQVFYMYKACTVNHGYAHDICMDIEHHQEVKKEVQITVSTFQMWNSVGMYGVPIILSLFLGAWSDRRGRKLPLIIGQLGRLIAAVMIVVNAWMPNWPLEYIIYTSTLPSSLLGAEVAVVSSCVAYMADVTTDANRTVRMTIFSTFNLMAMPIGVALGSAIYNGTFESFTVVFTTSAVLTLISTIYAILRLKSCTTDQQTKITGLPWYRMPEDFFDWNHVVTSMKIFVKKRPHNGRIQLYMMIAIVGFLALKIAEAPKLFLYTQLMFNWDVHLFSHFSTYQLTGAAMMQLVGVRLLTKVFKISDTLIILIATVAVIAGHLVFVFAQLDWLMYVGATVAVLGPMTMPVGFSMISRMIPSTERGVIFSLLFSFKIILRLVGGALYTLVYNASIGVYPQAFIWVTIGTMVISVMLILYVHASLQGRDIDKENQVECSNGQAQEVKTLANKSPPLSEGLFTKSELRLVEGNEKAQP